MKVEELKQCFCDAVNEVKRGGLTVSSLDESAYLGGDMGIDSIEMLEIWFRLEKALGVKIPDDDKRDIYTVGQALGVVDNHRSRAA